MPDVTANEYLEITLKDHVIKLPAGKDPFGIAISTVDSKIFVASLKHVVVYEMMFLESGAIRYYRKPDIRLIPTDIKTLIATFLACSPTDHKAYVSFISTINNLYADAINTEEEEPHPASYLSKLVSVSQMAFSPDGNRSYFPNGRNLLVIDEKSPDTSIPPIPLSVSGYWTAITNDGAYAYCGGHPLGNIEKTHIARVDLATLKEKDQVDDLFDSVISFDVTFDNTKLFVGNMDGIDIVDISKNRRIKTIGEHGVFGQIACSKASPRACFGSSTDEGRVNAVQVIDTINDKIIGSIPIGSDPVGITFDRLGNAYVTSSDDGVTVIPHFKLMTM